MARLKLDARSAAKRLIDAPWAIHEQAVEFAPLPTLPDWRRAPFHRAELALRAHEFSGRISKWTQEFAEKRSARRRSGRRAIENATSSTAAALVSEPDFGSGLSFS
jgi:hypothetical protein